VKLTDPFPDRLPASVMEIQSAEAVGVHVHPSGASTAKLPVLLCASTLALVGSSVNRHANPSCTTSNT
jgi:hypothetical protein